VIAAASSNCISASSVIPAASSNCISGSSVIPAASSVIPAASTAASSGRSKLLITLIFLFFFKKLERSYMIFLVSEGCETIFSFLSSFSVSATSFLAWETSVTDVKGGFSELD
jgi:hypothetical protein